MKLDNFTNNGKKKIQESIFENYQINYLTELDLCIDIVLIVYMVCAKILFFFFFL